MINTNTVMERGGGVMVRSDSDLDPLLVPDSVLVLLVPLLVYNRVKIVLCLFWLFALSEELLISPLFSIITFS